MLRFNDIADRILEYHPSCDLSLLQRAYVFSAKVHEGQERLSGEPYLIHPLEVAGILVKLRLDETTVAAGLLHDTIEDTLTTEDEIGRRFGDQVAFLVAGLTKIAKIEFSSARERQAENFRKMLIAMSKDIRILLIKLADRLHNMRTLQHMDEDRRRRIAQETLDIYAPFAHRLGINWMKQELEDLAFRVLKPAVVEDLERRLKNQRKAREVYIEEVIGILSKRLSDAGLECEVTGRVKDLSSVHAKMESQGISLDQIYDVIAFRIVIDGAPNDVYTALGIIHAIWRPVPGRFKDYVALPKPNGYQCLHTTVIGPYGERMEVQIRTAEMHRDAEFGIAAHWKYKEGRLGTRDDEGKFAWLRQLLEWQRELADPHEFIDTVKLDLFPDEVFVFTPRGDVINLPRGATPVDFAYAIHSEVGAHCAGAKVNGLIVALRQPLTDGDTVEIMTRREQRPRKDWLEFVVSGRARGRIRHAIRASEKASSRELGREILERELRKAGFSLRQLLEENQLVPIARKRVRGSVDDLFSAVGYGRLPAVEVVRALRGDEEPEGEPQRPRRGFFWRLAARRRRDRLRDARPRGDRAREGLPQGLRARSRASHRRRVGRRRRRAAAHPDAGALRRPARIAGQGHEDHRRGRRQHRRRQGNDHSGRQGDPGLRSVGDGRGDAQRGHEADRASQGRPLGRSHPHVSATAGVIARDEGRGLSGRRGGPGDRRGRGVPRLSQVREAVGAGAMGGGVCSSMSSR
jgi:GTP pyrophosphokinase